MDSENVRGSWATESWATNSQPPSRTSYPSPSLTTLSSQASSELEDEESTTVSQSPSPTSVPLPPALPNELAAPKPVHAIIHLKAELENILQCQRNIRNDYAYVHGKLHGVDYQFGPHRIRAVPSREVSRQRFTPVERHLGKDMVKLEARRKELVRKIAERMNREINQMKRENENSGKAGLEKEEKLEENENWNDKAESIEDSRAGSNEKSEGEREEESEAGKREDGENDDDGTMDEAEVEEGQSGDKKEQKNGIEKYDEKEHENGVAEDYNENKHENSVGGQYDEKEHENGVAEEYDEKEHENSVVEEYEEYDEKEHEDMETKVEIQSDGESG